MFFNKIYHICSVCVCKICRFSHCLLLQWNKFYYSCIFAVDTKPKPETLVAKPEYTLDGMQIRLGVTNVACGTCVQMWYIESNVLHVDLYAFHLYV